MAGAYDLAIGAGVESMSRVPMGSAVNGVTDRDGGRFAERYPEGLVDQGIAAELIAAKWGLSRSELDEFAAALPGARRRRRAAAARSTARSCPSRCAGDDGARHASSTPTRASAATTLEALAALRPAFVNDAMRERFPQIDWSVTAGNSSQISDGAAAVLLVVGRAAARLGLHPRARIHTTVVEADDPLFMLTAVIPATERCCARRG